MEKLKSRKLWFAVCGCIVSIALIVVGVVNHSGDCVSLGANVLAAAIIGYFVVEGGADWLSIIFEAMTKPKTSVTATTYDKDLIKAAIIGSDAAAASAAGGTTESAESETE